MPKSSRPTIADMQKALGRALTQPQILAFLPALTLGAYWAGGEPALLATALLLPILYAVAIPSKPEPSTNKRAVLDGVTGLPFRETVIEALEDTLSNNGPRGMTTACLTLSVEGLDDMADRFGPPAVDLALRRVGERLTSVLRGDDIVARLDGSDFAVALAPIRRADLETLLQISGRLQDAVREPVSIDATAVYLTSSVGFCLPSRSPAPKGASMLDAALSALEEARTHGPGAIRAFNEKMQPTPSRREQIINEVEVALESGQLRPWFQPQVSTDTGEITGFEALPRWIHPELGMIPPADFMPAIAAGGLAERLGEETLFHALSALRSWDRAGLSIRHIGLNLSPDELRNPRLAERIQWEIDRFELDPARLSLEIQETVLSDSGDDLIARNITTLAQFGCSIDLDGFGTGQASIGAIRRYTVRRLKIDRGFVARLDEDRSQQDMIAAILTMSERLGLETLANGVETLGEHAMLAQLGCGHVQGAAIAHPMPFEDTIAWVRTHGEKLETVTSLGRHSL